jgi:DNA processing protein
LSEYLACLSLYDSQIQLNSFTNQASVIWAQSCAPLAAHRQAKESLAHCQGLGARILFPYHADYPETFYRLEKPPLFLSMIGEPCWVGRSCLSVVGSREASRRAIEWMEQHLLAVVQKKKTILVSGGARGIDQKAHALSLRAGQSTIAFLPAGISEIYPADFASWLPDILACKGAVISEFAPHAKMRKYHFERRNRLIAALGRVTFVVEARRQSGSIMTARLARDADKTVCVLPSFPGDPGSAGSLDLLFDGAFPIRDAQDLLTLGCL